MSRDIKRWQISINEESLKNNFPKLTKLTINPSKQAKQVSLNPEQRDAVKTDDVSRLVVASAGSGKTRVLTERVIDLVNNKDVDPEKILLLTFTVKAGEEMRQRVAAKLGETIAKFITCGTFHSWAHRIIRRNPEIMYLKKNFSILDTSDSLDIFIKSAELCGQTDSRQLLTSLLGVYSLMRNKVIPIDVALKSKFLNASKENLKSLQNKLSKIIDAYIKFKNKYSMVDFDDLLEGVEHALEDKPEFRIRISSMYHHVFVDELQDCNNPQLNILKQLMIGNEEARKTNKKVKKLNLFACGDEAQSIYGFRGADFRNMLKFPEMFDANVSMLLTNYRSTQQILDFANAIGKNFVSARWEKQMVGTYKGEKPYYVRVEDETLQAEFVADAIQDMIRHHGFAGKEIAVLYRSNSSAILVEAALTARKIHYEKRGGQEFLEMAHIKDILSFIKATIFYEDVVGWTRMLQLHPGIGAQSAEKIYQKAFENNIPWESLKNNEHGLGSKIDTSKLGDLIYKIKKNNKSPVEAIQLVINYVEPFMIKRFGDQGWQKRLPSANALLQIAERFPSLQRMLTEFSLNPSGQSTTAEENAEVRKQGGEVILCSEHIAKGKEWNNVFIINVVEGKQPSQWFIHEGHPPKEINPSLDDVFKVDEERRIFYVACTRARHNLIIVSPMTLNEWDDYKNYGIIKDEHNMESRFMTEIPNLEDLVTILMPKINRSKNKSTSRMLKDYE